MSGKIYLSVPGRKPAPKAYRYSECGLDNVYLVNGFTYHDTPYGPGVSFHNIPGLHAALTRALVCKKGPLEPQEFRFLRNRLKLTQAEFAHMIRSTRQNIGRWERGTTDDIPGPADVCARICATAGVRTRDELAAVLNKGKKVEAKKQRSHAKPPGREWRENAAAACQ